MLVEWGSVWRVGVGLSRLRSGNRAGSALLPMTHEFGATRIPSGRLQLLTEFLAILLPSSGENGNLNLTDDEEMTGSLLLLLQSGMNGNPSVKRQVQWGLKTVIKLIVQVSVNPKSLHFFIPHFLLRNVFPKILLARNELMIALMGNKTSNSKLAELCKTQKKSLLINFHFVKN